LIKPVVGRQSSAISRRPVQTAKGQRLRASFLLN
jgi:hypothetical protein